MSSPEIDLSAFITGHQSVQPRSAPVPDTNTAEPKSVSDEVVEASLDTDAGRQLIIEDAEDHVLYFAEQRGWLHADANGQVTQDLSVDPVFALLGELQTNLFSIAAMQAINEPVPAALADLIQQQYEEIVLRTSGVHASTTEIQNDVSEPEDASGVRAISSQADKLRMLLLEIVKVREAIAERKDEKRLTQIINLQQSVVARIERVEEFLGQPEVSVAAYPFAEVVQFIAATADALETIESRDTNTEAAEQTTVNDVEWDDFIDYIARKQLTIQRSGDESDGGNVAITTTCKPVTESTTPVEQVVFKPKSPTPKTSAQPSRQVVHTEQIVLEKIAVIESPAYGKFDHWLGNTPSPAQEMFTYPFEDFVEMVVAPLSEFAELKQQYVLVESPYEAFKQWDPLISDLLTHALHMKSNDAVSTRDVLYSYFSPQR
jgi:hypothetical protein